MMFKDRYIHKFYAFALAAVFAIALAGCGGGGGTAQMPDPEPPVVEPEPTAQEMCEGDGGRYNADGSCTSAEDLAEEMALSGAQEAAMAAYMAAMAAVGGAKDPVAMANAQAQADMAKGASDAAAMATTSEMATEYQMKAEMYRDMAMEAGMTRGLGITKLANAVANKSAIDSAELVGTPPPAPVSNAGRVGIVMRGVARGDIVSIDDTENKNPSSSLSSFVNDTTDYLVFSSATHNGSAPRVSVSVSADNGTTEVSLMRGETPSAVTMRGGWSGAELTRSVSGATGSKENALVFTDINPPKQQYYADEAAATAANAAANFHTNAELVAAYNTAVITGEVPGDGSHFAGTLNPNPTDNNPPISGRFHCVTAPCSISVDSAGVLLAAPGYEFRPAIPGSITAQDSDYLTWGVWLRVPNALSEPGTTGLTNLPPVAAFASGNKLFNVKAALTGTATYNGVAAGLYSAAGMVEYFDADVSLTANFGGRTGNNSNPSVAADPANTSLFGAVTGTVTNIKAGGMDVDGSITLGRAALIGSDHDSDTETADAATSFTGVASTSIGGRAMSGNWGGRFYGPNKADESSVAARTEFPTTAAGTFGVGTRRGVANAVSILGSFGAWKAE